MIAKSYSKLNFTKFNTVDDLSNYITNPNYTKLTTLPGICFAFSVQQIDSSNFNYSLHYFDSIQLKGIKDVPNSIAPSLAFMQTYPNMPDYKLWLTSGYLEMMKIINDIILQISTNNTNASINFGMMAEKYKVYTVDKFGSYIGFIVPFFLLIAYVCPLCIYVFRMVKDKESRAKEGMKIMGLTEGIYFLSYFLQYVVLNTIYALINAGILSRVFKHVGFQFILAFFWLYGMTVFSLAFFFQAFMDKTRIAMIMSILIYFIMFFVSQAVLSDDVPNIGKMFISLLPPTALQIGINVFVGFEKSYIMFDNSYMNYSYNNYTVADMYGMFAVDIFFYLFLGFYFQNTISHDYGVGKPFYFLCTRSFWCKRVGSKVIPLNESPEVIKKRAMGEMTNLKLNENDDDCFQNEKYYEDRFKSGDCLRISDLRKQFDDGKVAVDGLNLNLYKEEIFALLGHNGAGKSTTISILSGLYEATSGAAYYNNMNVLENMDEFRKKLGICPQHDVLFENLTIREHLDMFCVFKGVESHLINDEVNAMLEEMNLTDKADKLAGSLSGGQKRKLSISIALIGGSEVVFLDEPSSGMDITSRRNLWEILKRQKGKRVIILTTHYMEEAAVLGNRIGIVSNGKLKCCGDRLFLIDRFGKYITLNIIKKSDCDEKDIIQFVQDRIHNVHFQKFSEEIIFRIPKNGGVDLKSFFKNLDDNLESLKIKTYSASMPTLEDVFLNISSNGHEISKFSN